MGHTARHPLRGAGAAGDAADTARERLGQHRHRHQQLGIDVMEDVDLTADLIDLVDVVSGPFQLGLDQGAAEVDGRAGGSRAQIISRFLERAPRVWVEVGHTLPLAQQLRAADKQLLLIRAPREWLYLDEAAFQDVYDIMQFKLPSAPVAWAEAKAPKKMTVPLRLTAGNAADVPELWVVRENAVWRSSDKI